jgi:hypothetical protein
MAIMVARVLAHLVLRLSGRMSGVSILRIGGGRSTATTPVYCTVSENLGNRFRSKVRHFATFSDLRCSSLIGDIEEQGLAARADVHHLHRAPREKKMEVV